MSAVMTKSKLLWEIDAILISFAVCVHQLRQVEASYHDDEDLHDAALDFIDLFIKLMQIEDELVYLLDVYYAAEFTTPTAFYSIYSMIHTFNMDVGQTKAPSSHRLLFLATVLAGIKTAIEDMVADSVFGE